MSNDMNRRTVMAVSVAAAALAGSHEALAQTTVAIEPRPLGIDPKAIKGISEKLIQSHYENNYLGAVRRLNAITAEIAKLDFATAPVFVVNGLKREQLLAANSMILHEVHFAGLGAGGEPGGTVADGIAKDFGSIAAWRAEFSATGKALGGGSGWVLLTYSRRMGRLLNQWASDHTATLGDGIPVLALDMYEHAYHMDYGARAAAYVDAYMGAINWPAVDAAYKAARGA